MAPAATVAAPRDAETLLSSTIRWNEAAVVGTATLMLMTERQTPERVAAFLSRMATQLDQK